ncbi:MAG: response regulator [Gammaproteobacteria bacterium]|nr:response regulator [Gammaproteobacteria bacterium]
MYLPDTPTVLCVDDEPQVLAALNRELRRHQLRVFTANGAEAALRLLRAETIHVIISDMRMPDVNGAQLLSMVRREQPQVVRIALTGHADLNLAMMALNEGAIFRYLSKPWDTAALADCVLLGIGLEAEREALEARIALSTQEHQRLCELNAELGIIV